MTALLFAGAMALLGLASGAAGVPPAAVISDVVDRERSGTAVGVFRFCGDLGFTLGPLVAGVSADALGSGARSPSRPCRRRSRSWSSCAAPRRCDRV